MKLTILTCLIAISLGPLVLALPELPERPDCNVDPVKGNAMCDILPPECRIPKCGRDYNYKKAIWFGNECYMNQFNKFCRTNFQKTIHTFCNANERPPPSLKPCPWPIKP